MLSEALGRLRRAGAALRGRDAASGKPGGAAPVGDMGLPEFTRVGLIDMEVGGWFRAETGELFEGFPIRADDVVLDVGCGDGGNIAFAGRQGARVAFADIDKAKVAETEKRVRGTGAREITPIVSDCDPIPLPDGFATVVICTEVIEHVADPDRFVAELLRVGRAGARYLISVPDPVMEGLQKPLAPPSYFESPNHIRVLERAAFAELLSRHGLTLERTHGFGFYWSIWWSIFWSCDIELGQQHKALDLWSQTWLAMLQTKDGKKIKKVLDDFAPKSQMILARKTR